jgi:hypothetical protein
MRSELQEILDLINGAPTQRAARKLLKWHQWRFDSLGPGDRERLLRAVDDIISQKLEGDS